MAVKYVFVTGGVVSGLGKGITAASLGRLLKARGYQVTMQKFDPYINVDPGTMNPVQHGEVFVTDDGTETDLDLGHYERFIDECLDKNSNVTTGKIYWSVLQLSLIHILLEGEGPGIALLDLGAKANIAASLNKRGCEVTVYPADTSAETILRANPDGIMLSNGPGDPSSCTEIISQVRKLYESDLPIFAICLGHQLMALANGAKTYKLTYGHRGGNHPVKDLSDGKVYISSQNHGYAVDAGSMEQGIAEELFVNVNDGTNEGLRYKGKKIMTVQFHPEANPGPQDTAWLFDKFIEMVKEDSYA